MAHSQFDLFLQDATYFDHASDSTLERDRFYGLYMSWCFINQHRPGAEITFWAAMKDRLPGSRKGLRMKGAAAADYIVSSYPELV
jgi:hypothetical protein